MISLFVALRALWCAPCLCSPWLGALAHDARPVRRIGMKPIERPSSYG